jgi:hypothetical protein
MTTWAEMIPQPVISSDRATVGISAPGGGELRDQLADAGGQLAGLSPLAASSATAPTATAPAKSKKVGDFPARKPGEPTVTNVTRYIQFHLFESWMIT